MKAFPIVMGGLAYFGGFQWDLMPESVAAIAVVTAFWIVVADIWSDPAPNRVREHVQRLAEQIEPRMDLRSAEPAMQHITGQPSEIDPQVLLSQLLNEDDQKWLKEQIEMIVEEKA